MFSKTFKSVLVVLCVSFFINFDSSAQMGVVDINMGRITQSEKGLINVSLLEKNTNHQVVATLFDERGNVVDVAKLKSSFFAQASWKVSSGSYKILLVNAKTGEREVHYAIL